MNYLCSRFYMYVLKLASSLSKVWFLFFVVAKSAIPNIVIILSSVTSSGYYIWLSSSFSTFGSSISLLICLFFWLLEVYVPVRLCFSYIAIISSLDKFFGIGNPSRLFSLLSLDWDLFLLLNLAPGFLSPRSASFWTTLCFSLWPLYSGFSFESLSLYLSTWCFYLLLCSRLSLSSCRSSSWGERDLDLFLSCLFILNLNWLLLLSLLHLIN